MEGTTAISNLGHRSSKHDDLLLGSYSFIAEPHASILNSSLTTETVVERCALTPEALGFQGCQRHFLICEGEQGSIRIVGVVTGMAPKSRFPVG